MNFLFFLFRDLPFQTHLLIFIMMQNIRSQQNGKGRGELEECREKALAFLTKKPHSVADLRRKLRGRGFSGASIDGVIRDLERLQLLDDLAVAKDYCVYKRMTNPPVGRRRVFQELRKHGIDTETAEAALQEVWDEDDISGQEEEKGRALKAGSMKLERLEMSADKVDKRREKLYRYLAGRGFSSEVIREVITRLLDER